MYSPARHTPKLIRHSSLDPSKIPDKLHCPVCDSFLFNGYKLSCCDQSICENCMYIYGVAEDKCSRPIGYSKISDHCPMCDHRPFTQDLCRPNKALRNTAKAFLKTAE